MYKVECPYCEYDNETEMDGCTEYDQECSNCGEEFEVTVEFDPCFTASKIECHDCLECGKNYRFEGWCSTSTKYSHLKYNERFVCRSCEYKIFEEEYNNDKRR